MTDKLIVIKEWKLFINRYENIIYNVDNKYKGLKNKLFLELYDILELIYYCNLIEKNKRINYHRKIISKIKMLDYYFDKLYKYHCINDVRYKNISSDLEKILKLIYGWMK